MKRNESVNYYKTTFFIITPGAFDAKKYMLFVLSEKRKNFYFSLLTLNNLITNTNEKPSQINFGIDTAKLVTVEQSFTGKN